MASQLDQKTLEEAFKGRPDIQAAIRQAASMSEISSLGYISLLYASLGPFYRRLCFQYRIYILSERSHS
jgi:hypothetical protein